MAEPARTYSTVLVEGDADYVGRGWLIASVGVSRD